MGHDSRSGVGLRRLDSTTHASTDDEDYEWPAGFIDASLLRGGSARQWGDRLAMARCAKGDVCLSLNVERASEPGATNKYATLSGYEAS